MRFHIRYQALDANLAFDETRAYEYRAEGGSQRQFVSI